MSAPPPPPPGHDGPFGPPGAAGPPPAGPPPGAYGRGPYVPTGPYGAPPGLPPQPPRSGSFPVPMLVGLALAAGGFILELSYHTYRSENGVVVDCDYRNFGPLLVGPVAVVLGLVTLARSRRSTSPGRDAGLGLLIVAAGVLHVLRGLGVVDFDPMGASPC